MGLLDTILGKKASQAPAKSGHASYVLVEDGDAGYATQAAVAALLPGTGIWGRIWEKTVPAQTAYAWGFGIPNLPDNQGYMWFVVLDDGVDFGVGMVRLGQENYSRHVYIPFCEVSDTALHSATNTSVDSARLIDKKQMFALPERHDLPVVGQDSRLTIDYKVITPATAADEVAFSIPVTVYN